MTAEPPQLDFDDHGRILRAKTTAELRASRFVLSTIQSPWLMKSGRLLARIGLALRVPGTESALERTVFRQFCGGTSLSEAISRADSLQQSSIGTILDYARESGESEDDFDEVSEEIARVISATANRDHIQFVALKVTGMARVALLEVTSQGQPSASQAAELLRTDERLIRLAEQAALAGTALFVDAEHSWTQPAIDATVERLMSRYNRGRVVVLTTVQMYLRDREEFLRRSVEHARAKGYRFGVKLVRGAYMEQEAERAKELGLDSPVQPSKAATDAAFDSALTFCLENLDVVTVCVATHNEKSVRHLVNEMSRLSIARDDPRVTASQLLGMFDRITYPLAEAGFNALKYVPYGKVREALPYLLRRADENKSVADQLLGELHAVREELARRKRIGRPSL